MQAKVGEYKVLAGYIFMLEESAPPEGVQWVECDACKAWRIVNADTSARVAVAGEFTCAEDTRRPVRGCGVAVTPGTDERTDDEQLRVHARPLLLNPGAAL
jgi:CW-type Zinc Finger